MITADEARDLSGATKIDGEDLNLIYGYIKDFASKGGRIIRMLRNEDGKLSYRVIEVLEKLGYSISSENVNGESDTIPACWQYTISW